MGRAPELPRGARRPLSVRILPCGRAAPLERLGVPEDIAEVVAFLASPAGHWINGQTVRANGGIV